LEKILKVYKNTDEYIAAFSKDVQKVLRSIRSVIKSEAKGATEAIKYGMPTFVLKGNLVHFAAYEKHFGFYPTPSAIKAFRKDLVKYKTSKGAIQFPMNKPVPLGLIKKIVRYRVRQNLSN
jgi:uncharacterized protein YdhG (YjbR/CyaY superfamily)